MLETARHLSELQDLRDSRFEYHVRVFELPKTDPC
jgi:hypothetical protein